MKTPLLLMFLAVPLPLSAQGTIPVENAPFKSAGDLAGRLDPQAMAAEGTFIPVPISEVTPELLEDAIVVDAAGNRIGAVDGVAMEDGLADGLIFRVGGVLGVLDHPVEVPIMETSIGRSEDYGVRVILDITHAELLELPTFQGLSEEG